MLIFWMILLWVIIFGIIGCILENRAKVVKGNTNKKVNLFMAIWVISIIVFFAGLRSGVSDTVAYINLFKQMPNELTNIISYMRMQEKDIGFFFLSALFKCIISNDFHLWLFAIAMISCLCIVKTIYKYSNNYYFSIYLFVSSCYFTWLFNGIRQFLAATIMFACFKLILDRDIKKFIPLVILASTIHITAIILIPIYYLVNEEPWSKKIALTIILFLIGILFLDKFLMILDTLLRNTEYSSVIDQFENDDGVNKVRVAFEFIPVIIAFLSRSYIKNSAPKYIKVCINMSLISALFYLIGSFTSGIYVGRMPIYCVLYNFILIPWLLANVIKKESKPVAYYTFFVVYLLFFYYQMVIAWQGYGYISDILNINLRWMSNWLY